jgi:hypothetical protein
MLNLLNPAEDFSGTVTVLGVGMVGLSRGRGVPNTTMIVSTSDRNVHYLVYHVCIRNYNYPRFDSLDFIGIPNPGTTSSRER